MAAHIRDAANALPPADDAGRRGADWTPLMVALVAPLILLQVAVVRPTTTQLARMRGQVARLESTIEELKEAGSAVGSGNGLLAELGEQQERIALAEASLDRFARLEARLERSVAVAAQATAALDELDGLVERVERQSALVEDARVALASLADVPSELNAAIDRAGRVAPTVARVKGLAERLDAVRGLADESLRRVEDAAAVQQQLAARSERLDSAHETLDGLVRLESRLNAPLMAVGAADDRLDDLLRLKDAVIARTDDLPAAFETFELILDLQDDYRRASGVLRTVQRLMADLVLLEPTIARIATLVEPVIQRSTISGLDGGQLRMVLREMRERRSAALARLEVESLDAPPAVASRPVDAAR